MYKSLDRPSSGWPFVKIRNMPGHPTFERARKPAVWHSLKRIKDH